MFLLSYIRIKETYRKTKEFSKKPMLSALFNWFDVYLFTIKTAQRGKTYCRKLTIQGKKELCQRSTGKKETSQLRVICSAIYLFFLFLVTVYSFSFVVAVC